MVRVELGRELRIELGDPVGVFVIPGACMSFGRAGSRVELDGPRAVVREPWSGDRGPRSASCEPGVEGRGPGSKKRAGFAEAAAKARFHTLDGQQNSAGRGKENHPL